MRANLLVVIVVAVTCALPAAADNAPFVQLVPYGGGRAGGGFEDAETGAERDLDSSASFALALELRYEKGDDRFWQLWYSRQESGIEVASGDLDVDVEYLHIGGTVPIDDQGQVHTYLAAGIGATRFSPSGPDLDDRTRFSVSLGLGLSVPVSPRVAFRVEARGYLTMMDTDTAIFCRSDNGQGFCSIVASGSSLFQAELLAGVAFAF